MTKQDYYGTKRVTAWPRQRWVTEGIASGPEGYVVRYADGYTSWSPKEVFEAAYKPITAMDLAGAFAAVKDGHTVIRADPEWQKLQWSKKGGLTRDGKNFGPDGPGVLLFDADIYAEDWMIVGA